MWKIPALIRNKLTQNSEGRTYITEKKRKDWDQWFEYVYALRILSDAIVIPDLKERALACSKLVVRRFHANIYDEICAQYAIEHKAINSTNYELAIQGAALALIPNVSLLPVVIGCVKNKCFTSSISSEKEAIINGVLEDIMLVFKLIGAITDNDLYSRIYEIDRIGYSVDVEKRPFIENNTDAKAYPPPLYDIFNDERFCFKDAFHKVAFNAKTFKDMNVDVVTRISEYITSP